MAEIHINDHIRDDYIVERQKAERRTYQAWAIMGGLFFSQILIFILVPLLF